MSNKNLLLDFSIIMFSLILGSKVYAGGASQGFKEAKAMSWIENFISYQKEVNDNTYVAHWSTLKVNTSERNLSPFSLIEDLISAGNIDNDEFFIDLKSSEGPVFSYNCTLVTQTFRPQPLKNGGYEQRRKTIIHSCILKNKENGWKKGRNLTPGLSYYTCQEQGYKPHKNFECRVESYEVEKDGAVRSQRLEVADGQRNNGTEFYGSDFYYAPMASQE